MTKKKNRINAESGAVKKMEVPFTQIANCVLNDKTLSLKAKGMFAYIYSKPHGWEFSSHRMAQQSSDGRDSILSAMEELMVAGYLTRKKLNTGKVHLEIAYTKPTKKEEKGTDAEIFGF